MRPRSRGSGGRCSALAALFFAGTLLSLYMFHSLPESTEHHAVGVPRKDDGVGKRKGFEPQAVAGVRRNDDGVGPTLEGIEQHAVGVLRNDDGAGERQATTRETETMFLARLHALRAACKHTRKDRVPDAAMVAAAADVDAAIRRGEAYRQRLTGSPAFQDVEFSCYSQMTDDGILLHLLAVVGVTEERAAIEMCSGVGFENSVANLAINFGFRTLMVDGGERQFQRATEFYARDGFPPSFVHPVFLNQFITAEGVNDMVGGAGFRGEIDVFSLDMDGVDYWIWKNLTVVQPRIVVVEIQELWGPYTAKTRPYSPTFRHTGIPSMGASIGAYVKLAREKGYRLVGCIEKGFNAFFVRNDLAPDVLPEYDAAGCFAHHVGQWKREIDRRYREAQQYEWVDV